MAASTAARQAVIAGLVAAAGAFSAANKHGKAASILAATAALDTADSALSCLAPDVGATRATLDQALLRASLLQDVIGRSTARPTTQPGAPAAAGAPPGVSQVFKSWLSTKRAAQKSRLVQRGGILHAALGAFVAGAALDAHAVLALQAWLLDLPVYDPAVPERAGAEAVRAAAKVDLAAYEVDCEAAAAGNDPAAH